MIDGLLRKVAWADEGGKTKGVFHENLAYLFGSSNCVFDESKLVNSHKIPQIMSRVRITDANSFDRPQNISVKLPI